MTETVGFRISQGFEVLTPKSGNAYPIPCDEWEFLKAKLRQVSTQPLLYQTAGSLFTGAGVSTFVTLLIGTLPPLAQSPARIVAGAIVAVELICGAACFFFAYQHRKLRLVQVADVITQMEIIERRYEPLVKEHISTILTILSAKYGAEDHHVDVTEEVNGAINHGRLRLLVGNHLRGDPAPNTPKKLVVRYSHEGRELEKTVNEGVELNLP
jgi:hypothetical protein